MFVVTSAAILLTGYLDFSPPIIRNLCLATIGVTIAGAFGIGLVLTPFVIDGKLILWLESLPRVGRVAKNMLDAVRMYRSKPMVLFVSSSMSVVVHCLFCFAIYLIARGLPGTAPPLNLFFVIVPLSFSTQVIPFSFGPLEFAMEKLYMNVPAAVGTIIVGQGFVIAICYRLISLLVAALGIYYYLGNRKEVTTAMHESEVK
jgi:glycosyltransferase 2 family protein